MRRLRRARRTAELMPSPEQVRAILADFPCLARPGPGGVERLTGLAAGILADKNFVGAGGLEPDYGQCLTVALLAAQPVMVLGLDAYRDFETFILYPDEFEVDSEEVDEAGVVHRGRDLRSGEAWHRGPVVLSLADVGESGQGDGYHVVVHELAHQLDQANGEADGFPPLPRTIVPETWSRTFSRGYERLTGLLERGDPDLPLDPYAAESPAEYFAVACECFFDVPAWLQEREPEIYRLLAEFFRQDPLAEGGPSA